jgi:hypothetical protein
MMKYTMPTKQNIDLGLPVVGIVISANIFMPLILTVLVFFMEIKIYFLEFCGENLSVVKFEWISDGPGYVEDSMSISYAN